MQQHDSENQRLPQHVRDAQAASDENHARAQRIVMWFNLYYIFAPCVVLFLSGWLMVVHWERMNAFLWAGTVAAVVSSTTFGWWRYMDAKDPDLLECPEWLRVVIVLSTWMCVVLMVLGLLLM
jgi:hypothetical protein